MTPKDRATRAAAAMWASDEASKWVGMTLQEVSPGQAVTQMTVQAHHTNGHKICHGGVIFTLADSAFAFACNSYNQLAVAQHNTISFVAPGQLGDVLTATARETSRTGRSGIYDVRVTRQDGSVVAEMRGCSRTVKGQHFPEEDES
ncbi:hydroxyphenylacetyl-CoA thioesterase PaaI [Candidatus Rhodobacter oscarellae]|uniref:hydroxyphenylacetyl-CoA thioesterase PaaI n=1 Tax=Candidatus Rhodobacter oscarellae TaxID=1675527 RepID=UPI00190FC24A|nr:hydroxyphenylacetyl-CoA thioesterase PaaI [Candidatus Rhodobacter lobularis]